MGELGLLGTAIPAEYDGMEQDVTIGCIIAEQVGRTGSFATTMIAYNGDDAWVSDAVDAAVACLTSDEMPASGEDCDNCRYYREREVIAGH